MAQACSARCDLHCAGGCLFCARSAGDSAAVAAAAEALTKKVRGHVMHVTQCSSNPPTSATAAAVAAVPGQHVCRK